MAQLFASCLEGSIWVAVNDRILILIWLLVGLSRMTEIRRTVSSNQLEQGAELCHRVWHPCHWCKPWLCPIQAHWNIDIDKASLDLQPRWTGWRLEACLWLPTVIHFKLPLAVKCELKVCIGIWSEHMSLSMTDMNEHCHRHRWT